MKAFQSIAMALSLIAAVAMLPACDSGHDDKKDDHKHAEGDGDHGHDDKKHDDGDGDGHKHKAEGEGHAHKSPHGGVVKTIGEYHAELVIGDEGKLTLYLLGDDENSPSALAVESISAQIKIADSSDFVELALKASPLDGETGGKSSRFEGTIGEQFHGKTESATIRVPIGDKTFRAQFELEQGHAHD